ncbi:MAG: TldD/PmbA family protein [Crenarchaeota archaeon]|nr:TldD/PmbA family protein [Thermoproteota archaeon]
MEPRDVLERFVAEAQRLGVEYADARVERRRFTRIEVREGVVTPSSGVDYGVAVRVYYRGSIGFAYTTRVTREAVLEALSRAFAMARAAGGGAMPGPVTFDAAEAEYVHPVKRSVADVPLDVKVSDLLELDGLLSGSGEVKSRSIRYYEAVEERFFASTEERYISETRELVYVVASVFGSRDGVRGSSHLTQGTIRGYTLWEKMSQEEFARKLLERLHAQLHAKTPKAGAFPVVLAPEAVGVFVHEAFGHLAEADLVAAGSALKGRKGEKVASEKVSIVDDPDVEDGFGTLRYDDEGVRTAKAVIVENGIHRQVMTDRFYASLLGEKPTGNARAESFRYPPLVRMRNTIMLPGDARLEEMLEGIEFGYYIVSTAGGQTNMDGSFQVGIGEAYEIVRGEIGEPVRNLAISGNTLETLQNIDMVGRDFGLFYGVCGKGQRAFVSDGGPHVRVKRLTIGGRA